MITFIITFREFSNGKVEKIALKKQNMKDKI